ncbi:hypothetical protein SODALDRAFT_334470 [Sodiomyces alkalinus F11]|uniref:TAFII55 protein conserved region domain-containing protein n=1 Tax=Sodiomyces alkalinus (strain CBS 110278 / VKM F-3762 / F11) TaxID=1314773 RepID=A0A3N2PSC7_SODAK|nr:hypothetical protein SODALDRAFT_334470 [Sodiomyces alkalinus F11]ROT37380.1 hypothetical protein SODALDRAFT_334470 [Sodiomyces alkalinus F11]
MSDIGTSQPPQRPKLKLSMSSRGASFDDPQAPQSAATPSATPKIILRPSQPSTPADTSAPAPQKTKAGRQTKPTNKLIESKKREQQEDDDDELLSASQPTKRIKLLKAPSSAVARTGAGGLILKSKGKPPHHPPGDGYDSEASDREQDPTIEEQFILRMMPGEHCDYIRRCMDEGKIGVPRSQGGADVCIKWLEEETRRAIVYVKGQPFAAVMVELPTITESMKTWDRKTLMKSADLCHMLLAFQKVSSEEEARKVPLPPMVQPGFKWPHGLTPPMHDAVNQRFAKVISRSEIELKEAEVKKLLQADAAALSTRFELIDDRQLQSEEEVEMEAEYSEEEEDAEGELDESGYFPADGYADGEMLEDDLAAEMEAAFEMELANQPADAATPATLPEGVTPRTMDSGTPAPAAQESANDEDEEEEEEEEEVSEEDEDSDVDHEEQSRIKGVKQDIAALKKTIAQAETELAHHAGNKILRNRLEMRLKSLRGELGAKLSSLPQGEEDDED